MKLKSFSFDKYRESGVSHLGITLWLIVITLSSAPIWGVRFGPGVYFPAKHIGPGYSAFMISAIWVTVTIRSPRLRQFEGIR